MSLTTTSVLLKKRSSASRTAAKKFLSGQLNLFEVVVQYNIISDLVSLCLQVGSGLNRPQEIDSI